MCLTCHHLKLHLSNLHSYIIDTVIAQNFGDSIISTLQNLSRPEDRVNIDQADSYIEVLLETMYLIY